MRTPIRVPPALSLAIIAAISTSCGGEAVSDSDVTLDIRREMVDGVEVVTIGSGSVWGAPANVAEELSIGALEGPDETMFAGIRELAVDDAGGIYIFDGELKELRYFDRDGNFVRQVGREGDGPGEYGDAALGMFVRSDGRLVLRDARNGRINVYEPDGEVSDTWPVASGLYTSQATMLGADDHMYIRTIDGMIREGEPWPFAILHLDDEGTIVDTLPDPMTQNDGVPWTGRFLPQTVWTLSRTGDLIVGTGEAYSFEIRHPDGTLTRVEKAWAPVAVLPEEKSEWEAMMDWQSRQPGAPDYPGIPDTKPAYSNFVPGIDGTIWVRRHVESIRVEPSPPREGMPNPPPPISFSEPGIYDVFEADGTYLGEVRLPRRTRIMVFSRDMLWGVRIGDFDESYVVRLRVEDPREMLETAGG